MPNNRAKALLTKYYPENCKYYSKAYSNECIISQSETRKDLKTSIHWFTPQQGLILAKAINDSIRQRIKYIFAALSVIMLYGKASVHIIDDKGRLRADWRSATRPVSPCVRHLSTRFPLRGYREQRLRHSEEQGYMGSGFHE